MHIELHKHAIKINQHRNKSIFLDYKMIQNSFPPRQKDVVEVLEQTILEYEKKTEKLKLN